MELRLTNSKRREMKTLYKSLLVIVFGGITLSATAQKDTTLNRHVMLEREYTPTLNEASKINTLPSVYEPVIQKAEAKFIQNAPQISLNNNILGVAPSGDIRTDIEHSKKRGYLIFGAGTHSNLDGAFGYQLVNTDNDQLDIFATYLSTNGDIDYAQKGYLFDKMKAKYSDAKVNLKYEHTFDPSILFIKASYSNTGYNYYGNSYLLPSATMGTLDFSKKQNIDIVSFGAGIRSRIEKGSALQYNGSINYSNFKSKYGSVIDDKGPKGGQLNLDVDFNSALESDKVVGVKVAVMNQSFSSPVEYQKDAFKTFTNITGSPYITFEGATWSADLGVNVSALFDIDNTFVVTPNVKAAVNVSDESKVYGQITGGVNNNTFLDILTENRYLGNFSRVEYSKTIYDAKIGFKSGVIQGLEFDIFGGYKQTNKDHLYLASQTMNWANVSLPVYADISTGQIGGLIKTNLIPYTDLSAKAVAYFYTVKYKDANIDNSAITVPTEKKAWGLPSFTAELNADIKPVEQLVISLSYLYGGGRKMFLGGKSESMKDISELNLRGEYQITDWASINVRLNNILSQKYELIPGYTLQGFNVLGGVSLKF